MGRAHPTKNTHILFPVRVRLLAFVDRWSGSVVSFPGATPLLVSVSSGPAAARLTHSGRSPSLPAAALPPPTPTLPPCAAASRHHRRSRCSSSPALSGTCSGRVVLRLALAALRSALAKALKDKDGKCVVRAPRTLPPEGRWRRRRTARGAWCVRVREPSPRLRVLARHRPPAPAPD